MVKLLLADLTGGRSTGLPAIVGRTLTSTRAISVAGVTIWLSVGFVWGVVRKSPSGYQDGFRQFFVGLVVVAIAGALASWVVRLTILRGQSSYHSSRARTLLAYVTVLVFVGLSQFLVSHIADPSVTPRPARFVPSLFFLYLIACLLDYFDVYRQNLSALSNEQDRLAFLRQRNAEQLFSMRSEIVTIARDKTASAGEEILCQLVQVRAVQTSTPEQLNALADEVRSELIGVIRKFSYDVQELRLDGVGEATATSENRDVKPLLDWRQVLIAVPQVQPFRPVLVGISLMVSAFGNFEYFNPLLSVISGVTTGLIVMLLLLAARFLVTPLILHSGRWMQWLLCVLTYLVASALGGISVYFGARTLNGLSAFGAWFGATLLTLVICFIWGILSSAQAKASQAQADLNRMINLTRQEAVALERERDLQRDAIAHELHGEVQSMLTAAAFRLDMAAEQLVDHPATTSQQQTAVAIDEAITMIEGAFGRIDVIAKPQVSTRQTDSAQRGAIEQISDLQRAWHGIVEVAVMIDPATATRLDARVNDASLTPAVVDIVREAILNATRHALAENIWIEIDSDSTTCRIQVENDGETPHTDIRPGLGQRLLDSLHCTWSLTPRHPDGAILHVRMALLTAS